MTDFYVKVGDSASFTKTVSESDVYQFAGLTGDFSPNHVNKVYMEKSSCGRLMAIAHCRDAEETPVAVGYDRIRFLKPVFLGDTVSTVYRISEIDIERRRSTAQIEVTNQDTDLVAVGSHILQWVPNS